MNNTRKIALTAILATLSTITFTIESLFPPLIIPGAKIGLSNIYVLFALLTVGKWSSLATFSIKVLLGSLFSGNFSAVIYSFPAGLIALLLEIVLLFFIKKVSIISTSISGAIINITIQNIIFCFVTKTVDYLYYLPYLTIIGLVSGLIVGLTVYFIYKIIPNFFGKFL